MTLTLQLTQPVEEAIKLEAERRGTTLEEIAVEGLQSLFSPKKMSPHPIAPGEVVAQWKNAGLLGSYGDPSIDAPTLARKLRERAEARGRV